MAIAVGETHDACMSVLIYVLGMTSELDTVWLVL